MKVKVELYASLREKAGARNLEWELPPGSRVDDLLERLRVELSLTKAEVEGCKVLVDGRDCEALGGRKAELKDGCVVSVFPPIAGG